MLKEALGEQVPPSILPYDWYLFNRAIAYIARDRQIRDYQAMWGGGSGDEDDETPGGDEPPWRKMQREVQRAHGLDRQDQPRDQPHQRRARGRNGPAVREENAGTQHLVIKGTEVPPWRR